MEPKRELTSVDLRALSGELGGYAGARLEKAYRYGEDLIRLKLRDRERGRIELFAEVGEHKRIGVVDPEHVPDAPGRPPDFAMLLRNRLAGATLSAVEQYEFDRIVELRFERDDDRTSVVVELFGDGNVAVLDADRRVLDALETVRLKSRTVAPGSRYEFPDSRVDPLTVDRETFGALMDESDTDVVRTLATQLNFGGLWGEELCSRAGVEKGTDIGDADADTYDALYDALERLAARLEGGDLEARVYYEDEAPVDVTPVPMEERAGLETEAADTFTGAVDRYFRELERAERHVEDTGPDYEAEIAKRERIIEQQKGAIEDFETRAAAERERAELLYEHYGLVDEILSTVQDARAEDVPWDEIADRFAEGRQKGIAAAEAVRDVDGEEGTVTVEIDDREVQLDASTGVEKNADRHYGEAKRIEDKKAGAEAAIEDTREELAEWRERSERAARDDGQTAEEPDGDDEGTDVDWLARESVPVRTDEPWYDDFRWFHTSDDFLVIGGRDADDNEALVKKYLEPGDRFFHAQAHGGPATILKATGPSEAARDVDIPEASKREAAQFAVTYSSVWKDGRYAGDVYEVAHDQVSKTPESGEYLEKGGFAIRGDRTYYEDTAVGCAVGIQCEPVTRVIGGPPDPIRERAETVVELEPGRYAQADAAKRIYREFRDRFTDTSLVRKVASPDAIQHFMPPGGSRIAED